MKALWQLLSGLFLFYLAYLFIVWYVKGHFGKYWYCFWLWTAFTIFTNIYTQQKLDEKWKADPRSGQEIWRDHWTNRPH